MGLEFTVVPSEIKTVPALYTEENNSTLIKFCVRMGMYTAGEDSIEVNFLETLVTINLSFDGSFTLGVSLAPKERTETSQEQEYTVSATLCDGYNPPFQQGQIISVCIEPAGTAYDDGIILSNITSFTWKRDFVTPQQAVDLSNPGEPADFLSVVEITDAKITVSSVLYALFFASDGDVSASGSVTMAFSRRRRLGESEGRRMLQDEDIPPAGFDISTNIVRATDGPFVLHQTAGGASPSLGFVGTVLGLVSVVLLA